MCYVTSCAITKLRFLFWIQNPKPKRNEAEDILNNFFFS